MVFHLILSNQKIFSENTVYSPHHGSEIISLDALIKMSDLQTSGNLKPSKDSGKKERRFYLPWGWGKSLPWGDAPTLGSGLKQDSGQGPQALAISLCCLIGVLLPPQV